MARPLESEQREVREVAKHAYDAFLRYYGANSEEAARLLATGESEPDQELPAVESAVLTMIANQLLNLDEVLNK